MANKRLQRTRPLLRMLLNRKGSGWGLAAEAEALLRHEVAGLYY
jgi:hypothetical protein